VPRSVAWIRSANTQGEGEGEGEGEGGVEVEGEVGGRGKRVRGSLSSIASSGGQSGCRWCSSLRSSSRSSEPVEVT